MTLNSEPENPALGIGKQKTGTEGQAGSPNPTGKRGPKRWVMLELMASKWDREMYFNECSKLAQYRTIKYLLKRIIKVTYT